MVGTGDVCPTWSCLCPLLFLPALLSAQPHPSCRAETQLPSQGGGWCSQQRCPLAPGNRDGAIGALMASPRSPDVRLAALAAWGLWAWEGAASMRGVPPASHMPLAAPSSLTHLVTPLLPKAVCLSAFEGWTMDRQYAAWWRASQEELEKGPMEGGTGMGASCTGVTQAAVKLWFAPLGRDLDADFEPCVCKRVHVVLACACTT